MSGFTPEDLFGRIDVQDLFGGLGFDFGEGLFDRFFRRRRAGPPRGADIEVGIEVPLARVLRGGDEVVRLRRPATCDACRGSGAKAGTTPRACTTCGGTGQRVASRREGGLAFQTVTTCPGCGGRRRVIEQPCPDCAGRGSVEREESLTVKIPIGVEEGMALRVPGRGLPSREAGGSAGDLFVVVRSAPDARFERDGADLWRVDSIPIVDAVLGSTLQVPTLDGHAEVTVPPGTQPDSVLRLRHQGLPEFGGGRRGDLLLRVRIQIPERLTEEERKLWERLRVPGRKRKRAPKVAAGEEARGGA